MWVKNINRFWEILLLKHSLSQNKCYFNLYEFLKQRIHALVGKLENRCLCWYLAAILVSMNQHSLRSRRLEVMGERENGRARGRHASLLRRLEPTWRFQTKLYKFR